MADDGDDFSARPVRLMNFVSEEELDRVKKTRGERVEDGTAQRDRPLYEILKENKEKKDAEFNERFKHRPPKALDEDEMEFLDKLEMKAVAEKSTMVRELKESPAIPKPEEPKPREKKIPHARPLGGVMISVKPQAAKKARVEATSAQQSRDSSSLPGEGMPPASTKGGLGNLVSYSDESEDE